MTLDLGEAVRGGTKNYPKSYFPMNLLAKLENLHR